MFCVFRWKNILFDICYVNDYNYGKNEWKIQESDRKIRKGCMHLNLMYECIWVRMGIYYENYSMYRFLMPY